MITDPIITPLIHSPKLPVYLETLNAFYAEEKKKRLAFYDWLTEEIKAEFIEGEVVIHSPTKNQHIEVCGFLYRLLSVYVDMHDLGSVKMEKALIRLTRNDFEPNICFFGKEKTAVFEKNTLFFPAPDFVVEVLSKSTEDRHGGIKAKDYALHGVQEYWMVDAEAEMIEQYLLEGDEFKLHIKTNDGNILSRVIGGFTIPVSAVFHKEQNVLTLQKLLTT